MIQSPQMKTLCCSVCEGQMLAVPEDYPEPTFAICRICDHQTAELLAQLGATWDEIWNLRLLFLDNWHGYNNRYAQADAIRATGVSDPSYPASKTEHHMRHRGGYSM